MIGSVLLAIISYCIFLKNIEFITKINSIVVPALIIIIFIVGFNNILKINAIQIGSNIKVDNSISWLVQAVIYSSYNLILVIPVLINLKKFIKNNRQLKVVSILTTFIICTISIFTFLLLVNVDVDFSEIEMPVVYVIKSKFSNFNFIYGIIILFAIFTTAISIGVSFLNNICKDSKRFSQISAILCITGCIVSKIGFAKLVQILFPLFGYLGIIQIFFLLKK